MRTVWPGLDEGLHAAEMVESLADESLDAVDRAVLLARVCDRYRCRHIPTNGAIRGPSGAGVCDSAAYFFGRGSPCYGADELEAVEDHHCVAVGLRQPLAVALLFQLAEDVVADRRERRVQNLLGAEEIQPVRLLYGLADIAFLELENGGAIASGRLSPGPAWRIRRLWRGMSRRRSTLSRVW